MGPPGRGRLKLSPTQQIADYGAGWVAETCRGRGDREVEVQEPVAARPCSKRDENLVLEKVEDFRKRRWGHLVGGEKFIWGLL